jgi:hypothetical protein
MAGMLGRMAGAAIGAIMSKEQHGDPVKGALIGAATMFVARRLLPVRIAGIGATLAAAYLAKKFADRDAAPADAQAPAPARRRRKTAAPATATAPAATAAAPEPAAAGATDRTVPPTSRSTKMPQRQSSNETA